MMNGNWTYYDDHFVIQQIANDYGLYLKLMLCKLYINKDSLKNMNPFLLILYNSYDIT